MNAQTQDWSADPMIWGHGDHIFEVFLEPTCPYSAKAFSKLEGLLKQAGPDRLRVQIWLQSQPWHLFSGIICRAIIAASTGTSGKESAKQVMAAVFANREEYEFDDHRTGPNLDTSPNELIKRIELASGIGIAEGFQISGLEREVKRHTRYARQNGIHQSPTFMVDGLINPAISSGDSIEQWIEKIFGA